MLYIRLIYALSKEYHGQILSSETKDERRMDEGSRKYAEGNRVVAL